MIDQQRINPGERAARGAADIASKYGVHECLRGFPTVCPEYGHADGMEAT
jgi:hypothetical protein